MKARILIDKYNTIKILKLINKEDRKVPFLIKKNITIIGDVVDLIVDKIKSGGRLFYIGAGSSGRIGILDASEMKPTFGVNEFLVQGIIAGGKRAIITAIEGAEDNSGAAVSDLTRKKITSKDVVVGLSASGTTPYTLSALLYAKKVGASTIGLFSSPRRPKLNFLDYVINVKTGNEIIEGSTRMKAGTTQKMILNMISTTVMIKLGKTYGNLMVCLQPTNEKLKRRAITIIKKILPDVEEEKIKKTLKMCKFNVGETILTLRARNVASDLISEVNFRPSSLVARRS